MVRMNIVLKSTKPIVDKSELVEIDFEKLKKICGGLDKDQLKLPTWKSEVIPDLIGGDLVDYTLLFNTQCFCFWAKKDGPKWTVVYKGKKYDGAWGLFAALTKAKELGRPILEGKYLARISKEELGEIFRGNVEIPLFDERIKIWHEIGEVLEKRFSGRFHKIVEEADKNVVKLVELLVENFPSFDDSVILEGRKVCFYKRAQLAPDMLYETFKGKSWGEFKDINKLTACADYKLPQMLRRFGILKYTSELALKIDNFKLIPVGSREEVEIRANTIWACELMRQNIAKRFPKVTARHIDHFLWMSSQKKSPDAKPYHRALTIFY